LRLQQPALQKNGMALFVVKILADEVRRAFDSVMLSIYTSNATWKIPANIEVFRNFFCWRRQMLCL
jgi:menaquinone-dependent protoporphyrinogen IX oxidase